MLLKEGHEKYDYEHVFVFLYLLPCIQYHFKTYLIYIYAKIFLYYSAKLFSYVVLAYSPSTHYVFF